MQPPHPAVASLQTEHQEAHRDCVCERVCAADAPREYRLLNKTEAAIRQCIYHPITATNPAPNT